MRLSPLRILFIGDIFGRPGRNLVQSELRRLVESRDIELVIANGENAAAGFGITPAIERGVEPVVVLGIALATAVPVRLDARSLRIEAGTSGCGRQRATSSSISRLDLCFADSSSTRWFSGVRSGASSCEEMDTIPWAADFSISAVAACARAGRGMLNTSP